MKGTRHDGGGHVPAPRGMDLIIFDCDGVLVDSEPISIAVLLQAVLRAGGRISEAAAYDRFLGRSITSVREILAAEYGVRIGSSGLSRLRRELEARFRRELRAMPGVVDALGRIAARRCVASSAQIERMRLSLQLTGLLELFEPHLYSAGMVAQGKPEPDLFLLAAQDMGVAPEHCVVIEDSPAGVLAAKRAGMRVVGFTGGSHAARCALGEAMRAQGPDLIFTDMHALPELLQGLGVGLR